MKITTFCLIAAAMIAFISCNRGNPQQKQPPQPKAQSVQAMEGEPVLDEKDILPTFDAFWTYYSRYISLNLDFQAADTAGAPISKAAFLAALGSGQYYPLRLHSANAPHYCLATLKAGSDPGIASYMKAFGQENLRFYEMEGKPLPDFSFTDVEGKTYTSANTKGKIVLIKCWFITCVPCVKEMPALNQLVQQYKDRDDILFISLAIDPKNELQQFLRQTPFAYKVVPLQLHYMSRKLNVNAYPTHFLVNKAGNLVHMLRDETEVAAALAQELAR